MIISASRRTDLPALYAPWLAARFAAGECLVPHPMFPRRVSRVSLARSDVDAVVLWTRHARPAFAFVDWLERHGFPFYFQYTVTAHGRGLEPRTPPPDMAVATFRELAHRLRPGAVVWRYDPIVLGAVFSVATHLERFGRLAAALAGATDTVVVSVTDWYAKTRRRVGALFELGSEVTPAPGDDLLVPLFEGLTRIAREHGLAIEACAEPRDLSSFGITPARCVDGERLARLYGGAFERRKDPGQREHCRCVLSRDIGVPDTCTFGCVYCYATRSDELARARRRLHDPSAPALLPVEPSPGAAPGGSS